MPLLFDPFANQYTQLTAGVQHLPYYPFCFQTSDDRVFYASIGHGGFTATAQRLNTVAGTWKNVAPGLTKRGSAVMYAPDRILKAGGAAFGSGQLATADVYIINPTNETTWTTVGSMAFAREYHNLVALPDGKVLAVGGDRITEADGEQVLEAETYDPAGATWKTMAGMQGPGRGHHSTALLLPDARVVAAGGEAGFAGPQFDAQIFSPPYLFDDTGLAPRLTIVSVVGTDVDTLQYGKTATVTTGTNEANQVTAVSLIRLGATTHGFDHDQRFLSLAYSVADPNDLLVAAPADGNQAPPGYYMLFILDDGVPSLARIVRVTCGDCQLHGDVFPFMPGAPNTSPIGNCVVDLDDILTILSAFSGTSQCDPDFPDTVNLFPCGEPCQVGAVDIDDILEVLSGFAGTFGCPHPCAKTASTYQPSASASSGVTMATLGGPVPVPDDPVNKIALSASNGSIWEGQTVVVEALATLISTQDIRAYQVAVDVSGGTSGTLDLEAVSIDITRLDFIFTPEFSFSDYVTATDSNDVRLASALYSGSVTNVMGDYLGAFTFRASLGARGTFTISIRLSESHLRDANSDPVTIDQALSVNVFVDGL